MSPKTFLKGAIIALVAVAIAQRVEPLKKIVFGEIA